jgi:flagellar assembly protein FliH
MCCRWFWLIFCGPAALKQDAFMGSILEKEEAESVVVSYTPRKFPFTVSKSAKEFHTHQETVADRAKFHIDPLVAEQTGVAQLERLSIERQVEKLALEKVKELQEEAYREAYQLGLDQGRESAFAEFRDELETRMEYLTTLLKTLESLKTELVTQNEAHFMKMLYHIASRVAMTEIQNRPDTILKVLSQVVEGAQSDERIVARVNKSDLEFITATMAKVGKDMEFLKRLKLEDSEEIRAGGCIIETNFGSVDATVEQRIQRIWDAISEKLPKVNDVVGGE